MGRPRCSRKQHFILYRTLRSRRETDPDEEVDEVQAGAEPAGRAYGVANFSHRAAGTDDDPVRTLPRQPGRHGLQDTVLTRHGHDRAQEDVTLVAKVTLSAACTRERLQYAVEPRRRGRPYRSVSGVSTMRATPVAC